MPDTYAGATITPTLTDAPQDLEGVIELGFWLLPAETIVVAATTSGITEYPQDDDDTSNYQGSLEIPDDVVDGSYQAFWLHDDVVVGTEDFTVGAAPTVSFATVDDVEIRLGRTLTDAQQVTALDVISIVQGQIIDEVDRDAAWAADLNPIPAVLKALCVGKAVNAISRPEPAIAAESLGAHSVTYARETSADIFLSEPEKRLARMAVYGTLTGSSTPRALHDRVIDLNEGRDVDELEA